MLSSLTSIYSIFISSSSLVGVRLPYSAFLSLLYATQRRSTLDPIKSSITYFIIAYISTSPSGNQRICRSQQSYQSFAIYALVQSTILSLRPAKPLYIRKDRSRSYNYALQLARSLPLKRVSSLDLGNPRLDDPISDLVAVQRISTSVFQPRLASIVLIYYVVAIQSALARNRRIDLSAAYTSTLVRVKGRSLPPTQG